MFELLWPCSPRRESSQEIGIGIEIWSGYLWPLYLCIDHSGAVGSWRVKITNSWKGRSMKWMGLSGLVSFRVIWDAPWLPIYPFICHSCFEMACFMSHLKGLEFESCITTTQLYLLFSVYTYFKLTKEFSTAISNGESIPLLFSLP